MEAVCGGLNGIRFYLQLVIAPLCLAADDLRRIIKRKRRWQLELAAVSPSLQRTMGNANGTVPSGPNSLSSLSNGKKGSVSKPPLRPTLTPLELAEFTGRNGNPIYISLRSEIYDVSSSQDLYGPGGRHAAFAGRDISRAVALDKPQDVGELERLDLSDLSDADEQRLKEWEDKFRDDHKYPSIGRLLIKDNRLTREQLVKFNGEDNPRRAVYVAVVGVVYDVTANGFEHYGLDGTYAMFAGHDASRALATMSLDPECLEDSSIEDLTPEQRGALNDWVTRFQQKYAVVGKLQM